MAKFPTYEEISKKVAEKVLDEFLYDGKSIREWMQIIASEDCISRQEVLDLINADWKYENLEIEINNLPSVTPQEPKTGHWIECMPGGAEEWCYKCSECDFWKYKKTINLSKFKYCPNCGAKMRGEEE